MPGQAPATTDDVGPPWPQPPGMQSGAAPASIHIHSTPGAASHLGEPMTEVEQLKAQIETMVAVMQQLSAQVEKLMSTPSSSWTPTTTAPAPAMPAPAPAMPAPAPMPQPQPQQQAGQQDPWQAWQRYQADNIATAQPETTSPPPTAQPGTTAPPPLRPINPKDVERPEKYDSTGDGWLE